MISGSDDFKPAGVQREMIYACFGIMSGLAL